MAGEEQWHDEDAADATPIMSATGLRVEGVIDLVVFTFVAMFPARCG